MPAQMIDGKALAAKVREEVAAEVAELGEVGLATVLVGDDPASHVYITGKHKAATGVGIHANDVRLPDDTPEDELLQLLAELNADAAVDGILVQLPLPPHLDEARVIEAIEPAKDIDGLHPMNAGHLYLGRPRLVPGTPLGIMRMLAEYGIETKGAHAVVIGRSSIVGKPMAHLLLQAHATVTICHSRTVDLARHTLDADILVAAVVLADVEVAVQLRVARVDRRAIRRVELGARYLFLPQQARRLLGREPQGVEHHGGPFMIHPAGL